MSQQEIGLAALERIAAALERIAVQLEPSDDLTTVNDHMTDIAHELRAIQATLKTSAGRGIADVMAVIK